MSRTLSPALAAAFASGVTTLCWCWIATRSDGLRLGFTDHDRDLVVDGATCHAGAGLEAGALDRTLDLAADQTAVVGALSGDAMAGAFRAAWCAGGPGGSARCAGRACGSRPS